MPGDSDKALLPAGLEDILPPEAAQEAEAVEHLIGSFAAQGYERVKPPLLEFEETLLAGAGAGVAQQTFRLMDPISQRMMGLRADMTPQVARIAAHRLGRAPRPLRLCYGGQVLRVRGSQLRSERQFGQVGAELIGAAQAEADAELVLLASEALTALGLEGLSIDVGLPPLVARLASALGIDDQTAGELRAALDHKDAAAVGALAGEHAKMFQSLLQSAGPAERALAILTGLDCPAELKDEIDRLKQVCHTDLPCLAGIDCHRRSGRTSGVRVPDRGFVHDFCGGRQRRVGAWRAVPGRAPERRPRNGHRIHALHGLRLARAVRRGTPRAALFAVRNPGRDGAEIARRRLGHGGRARATRGA